LKEKEYILFYCGNISDDLSGVLKSMTKFSYKLDGRLRLANSNKANVQDKMGCNLNGEDEGDNLNKENNGNITKTNSTNSNIKNTPTTNTTNPKLLFINKYENGLYEYSDEFTQEKIDNWIGENNLNRYGDPADMMYAGGTPLFNEATGESVDRYDYIFKNHPNILGELEK